MLMRASVVGVTFAFSRSDTVCDWLRRCITFQSNRAWSRTSSRTGRRGRSGLHGKPWLLRIERKRAMESTLTPDRCTASGSSAANANRWFTLRVSWNETL